MGRNRTTAASLIREEEMTLHSAFLDREVALTLLQPVTIADASPVHLLLLNDGQDIPHLQVRETLERLYAKDRLEPLLVVGIHAGERMQEYGTAGIPGLRRRGRKALEYTRFVLEELLPFIQGHTGIDAFATRAIAGCSMGGLSAMDIAWNHPEAFDKVGAFSGSFWWRNATPGKRYSDERNRIMHLIVRQSPNKPEIKFWFQAGTLDESADRNKNGIIDAIDDTIDLIRELEQKGYRRPKDIRYLEVVGGRHNTSTWAKAMPKFLVWAFGK